MIYLGTLDHMIGMDCPAEQSVSHAGRVSTVTTVEGRVKAMVVPESGRSWSLGVSAGARQSESATLQEFVTGAWGSGPFIFVPVDAPLTNLLSPREAACMEAGTARVGGPVDLGGDGWAASSLFTGDVDATPEVYANVAPVPVREDRPVTGSAWVQPGIAEQALLRLYWHGRDGAGVIGASSVTVPAGAGLQRVTLTATPPAGAVGVRLVGYKVVLMARPQITWTPGPVSWAAGEGCPAAVVHDLSRSQSTAWPGTVLSSVQYQVTEVM